MRIAMVTDSFYPTRDGVVTSLCITKKGLEDRGHEVFVVAPDPGEEHRLPGVNYFPAVSFSKYKGYYVPIFPSNKREILESLDVDIIHVHGVAVMALKALIAARAIKKPLVLTFHTSVGDTMQYYSPIKMPREVSDRLVWTYLRYLLKGPLAVIAPTEPVAEELKRMGVRTRRTAVIPTGSDVGRFNPSNDGTAVREKLGLKGKKVLIYVGRISFEKNIGEIVEVMPLLDDTILMLVGKGPAEEMLRTKAEALGVGDRVIFPGFVSDEELPIYYAAADAAISASRFETQGLSIIEAMATGLPVVCVNERAFSSFVEDGKNGFLFEDNMLEAIEKALNASSEIREEARRTAERFSIAASAKELEDLYNDAIMSADGKE
ncbi:MAG: glycosyltransferase [Candidatus Methanomethylophilaceae archaeon]|nr:glycosyltransferase [Candidatus Methanomethylophilaceae archaeon]